MKAVLYVKYGSPDVLTFGDVPKPVPKDNEILIKVRATTVTSGDWRARSLIMPKGFGAIGRLVFGISKPRQPILGTELAGDVEAIGKEVTNFKVGDAVFALPGAAMGSYAEYRCMPAQGNVALMPANLTYGQCAALSFGGTTALSFLHRAKLARTETVLINGASGGVGTAAIQLARHFGAEVTAVCSAANSDIARSLGANYVIDYKTSDFTENGRKYDVIMDTAGTAPFSRSRKSLKDNGRCVLVLGGLRDLMGAPLVAITSRQRIVAGPVKTGADDLHYLAKLAEAGEFLPFVDREFTFEQIVDAHRYMDTGRKRGNVVVTM